jgi:hypothetical protein
MDMGAIRQPRGLAPPVRPRWGSYTPPHLNSISVNRGPGFGFHPGRLISMGRVISDKNDAYGPDGLGPPQRGLSGPLPGAPERIPTNYTTGRNQPSFAFNTAAFRSRAMIYANTSAKISACCPGIADGHNPTFGCWLIFAIHGPWSEVLDQGPAFAPS